MAGKPNEDAVVMRPQRLVTSVPPDTVEQWVPSSYALSGGFAIGERASLLRQHDAEREMSASACTRSVPGVFTVITEVDAKPDRSTVTEPSGRSTTHLYLRSSSSVNWYRPRAATRRSEAGKVTAGLAGDNDSLLRLECRIT